MDTYNKSQWEDVAASAHWLLLCTWFESIRQWIFCSVAVQGNALKLLSVIIDCMAQMQKIKIRLRNTGFFL